MIWLIWFLWATVCTGGCIGIAQALRIAPRYALVATAVLVTALAVRVGEQPFYGLEYEDAYVYTAAARTLDEGWDWSGLRVCAVGSLEECREWERFPGHLPGLPALLRAVSSVTGYYPGLAPNVGAVLSSLGALFVWWAAWVITSSFAAATGAAFVFAVTPVFALYGGSACSESASAVPFAVAFGAMSMQRKAQSRRADLMWQVLALASALLALSIRRENSLLLFVLPACLLLSQSESSTIRMRLLRLMPWLALSVGAGILVSQSLVSEVGEYGQISFGAWRLFQVAPVVLRALVSPEWFGLTLLVASIGTIQSVKRMRSKRMPQIDNAALLGCAGSVLVMVALYASHVRSTYQLMGVSVEPFDFLRYLSNLGVLLSIPTGAVLASITAVSVSRRRAWMGPLVAFLALSYVTANLVASRELRSELTLAERDARIDPAVHAIEVAAASNYELPIITLEPMVVQTLAAPKADVIGLAFLTAAHLREFAGKFLYIRHDHYFSQADRQRYGHAFDRLPVNGTEIRSGPGWTIVLFGGTD